MIQKERAIQIGLDVITDCDDPPRMPLAERGRLHARCRQLVAPTVVVIQTKVVLQGVGPHDIVVPLSEAKHNAAGSIFPARHRLEADRAAQEIDAITNNKLCPIQEAFLLGGMVNQRLNQRDRARALFQRCADLAPRSCMADECRRYVQLTQ